METPLILPRRGLAAQAVRDTPWHLLPMIACESVCGDTAPALLATAAMQFMLAAGDVLDDVEDADSADSLAAKYGQAVAVNVGSALIIMAEQALSKLNTTTEARLAANARDIFNECYARACHGQHLELTILPGQFVTEEDYLKMIGLKSASQIECACHLGALLAGADEEVIGVYRAFGYNLGMASQLANDSLGITSGKDIVRRKMTVAVIFALNHANPKIRAGLEAIYMDRSEEPDTEKVRTWLQESGGVCYCTIQQDLYKERAADHLSAIAARGMPTERFWPFLE